MPRPPPPGGPPGKGDGGPRGGSAGRVHTEVEAGCRGQPAYRALESKCHCGAGLPADAWGLSLDCRGQSGFHAGRASSIF